MNIFTSSDLIEQGYACCTLSSLFPRSSIRALVNLSTGQSDHGTHPLVGIRHILKRWYRQTLSSTPAEQVCYSVPVDADNNLFLAIMRLNKWTGTTYAFAKLDAYVLQNILKKLKNNVNINIYHITRKKLLKCIKT